MYCKNCGNEMPEGAKFCVKCGAAVDPEKGMVIENNSKSNVRQSIIIAIAVIALVLTAGMVLGVILLHQGSRRAEQTVADEEVTEGGERVADEIITPQDIANANPIWIAGFESISLSRRNHIPGQKISGTDWEDEFFYWFEDTDTLSDENDNYISKCNITHYQMFRKDSGRNIEYEVYRDPANEMIYKIVSIEQTDDGRYELVDYYYVDGKPYFIYQRYDFVYTPTYATLGKPGMRYYFNDDTLVRCRSVGEDLKVSQTGLLLQGKAGFEEFDYFTAPEAIHEQYEQLEMEWLNKAYNSYDAIRDGASIGILRGTVRDMAGNALEGYHVYVQNTEDGSIIYQAETDGDGIFLMYVYLDGKDCLLYVAGDDTYEGACVYGVKLENTSLYYSYDSLILHSFDSDSYPVTLQLCNAEELNTEAGVFAGGVTGADIIIRKGTDARQGASVYEGISDDSGVAEVTLPSGSYTAEISCEGYATNYINLEVADTGLSQNIYMIKSPQKGQTAILMTWSSEMDKDLDLTVFTPYQGEDGDMAHIGGTVLSDGYGNRILHDNSMGCEIAYIDTTKAGVYKVYVNDYTDSIAGNYDTGIYSELDVHIYVYQPGGYVTEINVPGSARGVVWEAAQISGNRILQSQRVYAEIYGKNWWTTNKHTE